METEYVKPAHIEEEARTQIVSIGWRANPSQCVRCGGLMVADRYIDLLDDTGQLEFTANRCIQCGEVVDATILRNRMANKAGVQSSVPLAHVA
jgi:ferredoxin